MFTWNIEYRPIKPKGFFSLHLSCFEKVFSAPTANFWIIEFDPSHDVAQIFLSSTHICAIVPVILMQWLSARGKESGRAREWKSKRGQEEGDCIPSPKSWCERKWFYLKRIATINTATVLSMEILSQYPVFSLPQQKHPFRPTKFNFYRQRCK